MDDENTFLILYPRNQAALQAFELPHNAKFYTKGSRSDIESRESTPFESASGFDQINRFNIQDSSICVSVDQYMSTRTGRLCFGSDPAQCDILLTPKRRHSGISGLHFWICFETLHETSYLSVRDVSTNGLIVHYEGLRPHQKRRDFRWILFPQASSASFIVGLQDQGFGRVEFAACLPRWYRFPQRSLSTFAKVTNFRPSMVASLGRLNNITLDSSETSLAPSERLPENQQPIYWPRERLGAGSYGCVHQYIDVSTGEAYAGKECWDKTGSLQKELSIIRRLKHEHIVRFVDICPDPNPILMMEIMPLGDLMLEHERNSFNPSEVLQITVQCLEALAYLHGQDVTHRDLKPTNILVQSRQPLCVKLADFGLAKNTSDLRTFCGSRKYLAPELFESRPYTAAVDIWSLGVVILELFGASAGGDVASLREFAARFMLETRPEKRASASTCLKVALELKIYDDSTLRVSDHVFKIESQSLQVTERIDSDQDLGHITVSQAIHRGQEENFVNGRDKVSVHASCEGTIPLETGGRSHKRPGSPISIPKLDKHYEATGLDRQQTAPDHQMLQYGCFKIAIEPNSRMINASQILKAKGIGRHRMPKILEKHCDGWQSLMNGKVKFRGCYVTFAQGQAVCDEIGLDFNIAAAFDTMRAGRAQEELLTSLMSPRLLREEEIVSDPSRTQITIRNAFDDRQVYELSEAGHPQGMDRLELQAYTAEGIQGQHLSFSACSSILVSESQQSEQSEQVAGNPAVFSNLDREALVNEDSRKPARTSTTPGPHRSPRSCAGDRGNQDPTRIITQKSASEHRQYGQGILSDHDDGTISEASGLLTFPANLSIEWVKEVLR